jgi:hypothetical protein
MTAITAKLHGKLYEIKGEMQKLGDFEFYEHDENIPMPPSFKRIATQNDGTHIYGNHTYGRSIRWEHVPFFNRYGWVIRKMWKSNGEWEVYS